MRGAIIFVLLMITATVALKIYDPRSNLDIALEERAAFLATDPCKEEI